MPTLGLSTYQWNNNLKSTLLLLMFPLLLLLLLGGIFYVFGFFAAHNAEAGGLNLYFFNSFGIQSLNGTYTPFDLAQSAIYAYWPIVTGIAVIWLLVGYFFNDAMIRASTGARPVTRQEEPRLYALLENLCISRGMKTPNLYIIDSGALNAYASGVDEKSYAVTLTRGLVERLDEKELEAVLAHELSHIVNRDCRLLIVTIVFVGMISFVAQLMWRGMRMATFSRDRRNSAAVLLMLIAGIILFIGYILALVLRFAISRKREYLADAGSVELTKNPEALISALRKISEAPEMANVPSEVRQMFIENPPSLSGLFGLFATHPPMEERIKILQELGGLPPEGRSVIPSSG